MTTILAASTTSVIASGSYIQPLSLSFDLNVIVADCVNHRLLTYTPKENITGQTLVPVDVGFLFLKKTAKVLYE
jgi:hypothetical protein